MKSEDIELKVIFDDYYQKYVNSKVIRGELHYNDDKHFDTLFVPKKETEVIDTTLFKSGIYFLEIDGFVTYIGMSSICIYDRIMNDHAHRKWFNSFRVVDVDSSHNIYDIESLMINVFNPYHNNIMKGYAYKHFLPAHYEVANKKGKSFFDRIYNINRQCIKQIARPVF